MISMHKYDLEIKKMIIYVNVMLIVCLFMSTSPRLALPGATGPDGPKVPLELNNGAPYGPKVRDSEIQK